MKTKNELIKELFNTGKINIDEALVLASNNKTDSLELLISNKNKEQQNNTIKNVIDNLVYKVSVQNIQNTECGDETDYSLNTAGIVKFMNDNDWKWLGQSVDQTTFIKQLQTFCRDVLTLTIEDYREGKYDPMNVVDEQCYRSTESGGLRVFSYIMDNELILEAEFIADYSTESVSLDELGIK